VIELRDYQGESVDHCYDFLRTKDGHPLIIIPTGGGKTPVIATLCTDAVQLWNGRVLVLAHVKELLEQTAGTLRRMCPTLPVGVYSAGLKSRDTRQPVIVAGIQSVYDKADQIGRFDLVIVDECFPAGTLIDTPSGPQAIETICSGMHVRHALGVGEVLATSARPATFLTEVEFDDGAVITCTPNHPVFTTVGWVRAAELERGSMAFGVEGVRLLREGVSPLGQGSARRFGAGDEGASLDPATVLLNLLLEEAQQRDEQSGGAGEGGRHAPASGTPAGGTRGQREAAAGSPPIDARSVGAGLDAGARGADPSPEGERLADPLQDRPGQSGDDDRHRDRRPLSLGSGTKGTGPTQDGVPGFKRVVRVAHLQRDRGQVVYNLHVSGHPSYFANGVLVHNCHLIPPEGEGRYRTLLDAMARANPDLRVIGLTATPYRLSGGLIYGPDRLFAEVCYEVGVKHLVQRGYLCPLVGKAAESEIDSTSLKVVRGEFDEGQTEQAFADVVSAAVDEVVGKTVDRRAVLLFCQTVQHGRTVAARLRAEIVGREKKAADQTQPAWADFGLGDDPLADHRIGVVHDWLMDNGHPTDALTEWLRRGKAVVGEIYGDTPDDERAGLIEQFRKGELRYLVNVNVLTTGFDAPNVDCVCLLRATVSAGLYYQMVGRGFRLSPNKINCLVLDFGQNIKRHGPVDKVSAEKGKKADTGEAVAKMCPECRTVVAGGVSVCPDCNYVWPVREFEPKHAGRADGESPLSGKVTSETIEVLGVEYKPHTKKDAPPGHPKTMRVSYKTGVGQYVSEWVCVEHEEGSFARAKAEQWWRKRCKFPMPDGVAECVSVANHGLLATPVSVTLKKKAGEKYPEIGGVELGEKPDHPTPCPECGAVNESVIVNSAEPYHAGRVTCGMCGHYLWPASQEEVERFGFYRDHHRAGLLPDGWEFDTPATAEGVSLFEQIENHFDGMTAEPTQQEIDEVPW